VFTPSERVQHAHSTKRARNRRSRDNPRADFHSGALTKLEVAADEKSAIQRSADFQIYQYLRKSSRAAQIFSSSSSSSSSIVHFRLRLRGRGGGRGRFGCGSTALRCVADFQIRKPSKWRRAADLEVGDTAGLETCATASPGASGKWSRPATISTDTHRLEVCATSRAAATPPKQEFLHLFMRSGRPNPFKKFLGFKPWCFGSFPFPGKARRGRSPKAALRY